MLSQKAAAAAAGASTSAAAGQLQGVVRNRTAIFLNYRKENRVAKGGGGSSGSLLVELQETKSSQKAKLLDGAEGTTGAAGTAAAAASVSIAMPPVWTGATEDIQGTLDLVRRKVGDLQRLHANQFLVQVDDTAKDEQQAIEIATAELSRLLGTAQGRIKHLSDVATRIGGEEANLLRNVQAAFAQQLGELTKGFRAAQQAYLTRIRKRNEKFRDSFNPTRGGSSGGLDDDDGDSLADYEDKGFTDEQMGALARAEVNVAQRDREIRKIHKSIIELSDIVKDLSMLIADQGTILDRIDYNIENTAVETGKAVEEIRKAADHQKSARTKMFILILIILVVIGGIVLLLRILGLF
jgi:syntaxin 16